MSTPHMFEAVSSAANSAADTARDVASGAAIRALFDKLFNTTDDTTPHRSVSGAGFMTHDLFYPVRPLTEEDSPLLREFLEDGLSDESRYRRFLSPMPRVTSGAVHYLADRDGRTRVALIALDPEATKIVGMAEYAITPDNGPPEVAFAVADDYQGKGIGKHLLQMLATLSIAGGYPVWEADVLTTNTGASHLVESVGTVRILKKELGVESMEIDLDLAKFLGNGLFR